MGINNCNERKVIAKPRETYIDAVSGLLVLWMMISHVVQWAHLTETDASYLFLQYVLGFFMLWFCFKAGMFFKTKPIRKLIESSYYRLIIPFLIFSAVGYITWSCKMLLEGETNWRQFVYLPVKQILMGLGIGGNLPLWYLLTLFVARIIFNFIAERKCYIFLVVFAFVPWIVHYSKMDCPLYVSNISMAVLFMGLGYLMKPFLEKQWLWISCFVLYVALVITQPTYVDMRYNSLLYGNYYLWYIMALAGIIAINGLFRLVPYKMPILTYVGKNSMAFFCLHWILLSICRIFFLLAGLDYFGYVFVVTAMISCLLLIPLINELLKKYQLLWLLGGNDRKVKNVI